MVCMLRRNGVEISEKLKCEKKRLFRKVSKHCKCVIHSVRNVGNDGLNFVCYRLHGADHRSRNFGKAKMYNTNCNLEKFQNTVNVICSVRNVGNHGLNCVCHSFHGAHHRSRNFVKAKMCKTNCNFEKFENTVNLINTVCAKLETMV